MSRQLLVSIGVVLCLAAGTGAGAQTAAGDYSTPAHVSAVQGTAVLERNGRAEAAVENLPLLEGDRLRIESGRLEAMLPDGSVLALDGGTTLDLLAGGLIRLSAGRLVFVVSRPTADEPQREYQVDAPAAMVRFHTSGEYRVSVITRTGTAGVDVAVVHGQAVLDTAPSSVILTAGQRAIALEGQGIMSTTAFNSATTDDFYAWADALRSERVGSQSNAYLPDDLQVYGGAFDREGTWDSVPEYGYVWYPRVAADWRPYYDGSWYSYGWGWTWVGGGRWVWPTHHYGRWGYGARGWFWVPTAAWGPGWVSWGMATDYVAWCPLGWNGSPVFSFSSGYSHGWHSDPWRGWTVAPQHAFARGGRVPSYALHGDGLRSVEPSQFAVRRTAPAAPAAAANRDMARPFGSSYGRGPAVAGARSFAGQGRTMSGAAAPMPERPSVAQRPWSADASTPYASAQAAAAMRLRADQGRATAPAGLPSQRPGVAQRPWSAEASSPYGSAQAMAAERLRRLEPVATPGPRRFETQPFASPSQTPLPYPDRFRSTGGSEPRGAGSVSTPRYYSPPDTSGARPPSPRSYSAPGAGYGRPSGPPSSGGRAGSPGGVPASAGHGGSSGGSPSRGSSGGGHRK